MARANFVKSARKDNPVAKKGESYYWWKFRYGGKHYSKTSPRRSQLINSPFLSGMEQAQEAFVYFEVKDQRDADDLISLQEEVADNVRELAEEAQGSLDNMPDSLQEGPTGEMLQSRVDEGEYYADEIEGVDIDIEDYEGPKVPEEGAIPEEFTEWLQEKVDELAALEYAGE